MSRPNILLVVFDDLGYSDFGCYGSTISTPNVDSLADSGWLFTNFTATPLCSPTRASLLTGRNQHLVGMGSIVQFAGEAPGYTGVIPKSAAMIPRILRDDGYATFAVGKWHLSPSHESGPAGPFDRWPLGQGFERFYGFLPGKTDHWHPEITIDNHVIGPPPGAGDDYHLSRDLADRMIGFMADHLGGRPDVPFFAYLAFGAVHSPHHAPPEHIARYEGAFDRGWDHERDLRFARQLELGIFGDPVGPAPPNPETLAWVDLPEGERGPSARFMEAFAGFLTHADTELGRVLGFLERTGALDDTIVIVISDNGATDAGRVFGSINEDRILNRLEESHADRVDAQDKIGSKEALNQYPSGWGQASNTPFRWYKHTVHNGGIRCPLVIRWPQGRDGRKLVTDHVHVTDIAPTLLEAAGVTPPQSVGGVPQIPMSGASFLGTMLHDRTFRRDAQYFEVRGHRALIDGRWKAVARHTPGTDYGNDQWELFDLDDDPAETNDLAAEQPQRLESLITRWQHEADENQVMPLDDRGVERLLDPANLRPSSRSWCFRPEMTPVPAEAAPGLAGRSFRVDASLSMSVDDEGVIFAAGGTFGGFALYVAKGDLVFHFNAAGDRSELRAPLAPGRPPETLTVELQAVDPASAVATMQVDGAVVATGDVVPFLPLRMTVETMQCGRDLGTPVSSEYVVPFPFTGVINEVGVEIGEATTGVEEAIERKMTG